MRNINFRNPYIPLITVSVLFLSVIAVAAIFSYEINDGNFIYALDDAYIHTSIAKNFSQHGVWGVTKYEFTNCSSSPLWTFLLGLIYFITGTNQYIPFFLNILFSLSALTTGYKILELLNTKNRIIVFSLAALTFFTPFTSLVFTGLEHSMQVFLLLLTVYFFSLQTIFKDNERKYFLFFLITVMLMTAARYECLFISAGYIIVMLTRKKFVYALITAVISIIPAVITGFVSIQNGSQFFPSSIIIKGNTGTGDVFSMLIALIDFGNYGSVQKHIQFISLLSLLTANLILLRKDKSSRAEIVRYLTIVFITGVILQDRFASFGSLSRYGAFLAALGLIVLAAGYSIITNGDKKRFIYIYKAVVLIILIPFYFISVRAVKNIPVITSNIYGQQIQMSKFIGKYYVNSVIGLNDIGAVNFFNDIKCIDFWGLANKDVLNLRKENKYNTEEIRNIADNNNVRIALLYDTNEWFGKFGGLPTEWKKSGEWTIPKNLACGSPTVSIYAVDTTEYLRLKENLKEFSKELPQEVEVRIFE